MDVCLRVGKHGVSVAYLFCLLKSVMMYLGGRHYVLHKGLKFFQDQLEQMAEYLTDDLQH